MLEETLLIGRLKEASLTRATCSAHRHGLHFRIAYEITQWLGLLLFGS
jgi:hypothetical protein